MPIDPNIILGIRPPQIQQVDPVDRFGKLLAVKNMQMQGDVAERGMADEEAVRAAYQQSGGDMDRLRALLTQGGQYKPLQALDKFQLEKREKESLIGQHTASAAKSEFDVKMQKLQHGASLWSTAKDQPSYEAALRAGVMTGVFEPKLLEVAPKEFNPQFIAAMTAGGLKAAEKMKAENDAATLAQTTARDAATNARGVQTDLTTRRGQDMTATTAAAGQAVTLAGQNVRAQAAAGKHTTAVQSVQGISDDIDNLVSMLEANPNLAGGRGKLSRMYESVTGFVNPEQAQSDAHLFESRLQDVKSRVQLMRADKRFSKEAMARMDSVVQGAAIGQSAADSIATLRDMQEKMIRDVNAQGAAPAEPATPAPGADKFVVGKTYKDANGNTAKYLGNGKWQ